MNKRMVIMLVACAVVFGGIFGFKWFVGKKMNEFFDNMPQPPANVSATEAKKDSWALVLEAVGTVKAIKGVDVTTEASGVVDSVNFESGDKAKKGDVLLTLDAKADRARLDSLKAAAQLAQTGFERTQRLYKQGSISKSELDRARSQRDQALAEADAQRELVAQKTIRAPFSGDLGIRKVDIGQYLSPGTAVVSLQQLNPVYVDFSLPEQNLGQIKEGLKVRISLPAWPDKTFEGEITAMEPGVDAATRNFNIQASFNNPERKLRPGMFARVTIQMPQSENVVVVPRTAISFNPYGNSVYVIEQPSNNGSDKQAGGDKGDKQGAGDQQPQLIVKRRFVKTGRIRGDLIAITSGLKEGERVATSGLLKLRNNAPVKVNNDVQPPEDATPHPDNS